MQLIPVVSLINAHFNNPSATPTIYKQKGYRVLVKKSEGRSPPWRKWEENIKMDLREVRRRHEDWSGSGQEQVRRL